MSRLTAGWFDFEPEPDGTGDGSGDPDKHILTIVLDPGGDNDEVAVIVHRTCDGKFPIDGPVANHKRRAAQVIVDALNSDIAAIDQVDVDDAENHAARLVWTEQERAQ